MLAFTNVPCHATLVFANVACQEILKFFFLVSFYKFVIVKILIHILIHLTILIHFQNEISNIIGDYNVIDSLP
jgi:hypothetical protein